MSLAERVKTIRDDLKKTQKEMAFLVDVGLRTWQQYEEGVHDPSWKVVTRLADLGYNLGWLANEEGPMKRGEVSYRLSEGFKNASSVEEGYVHVPRYKVDASAGGGTLIHSEQIVDYLSFRAEWVHNALGVSAAELVLINVKGDSMEPTLSNGDVILIDKSVDHVDDNAIYVLRLNGTLLVKRIKRNMDGSMVVISDNGLYPPETVKGDLVEGINVVGRVVWCGRRM